jgi:hypothetical protein
MKRLKLYGLYALYVVLWLLQLGCMTSQARNPVGLLPDALGQVWRNSKQPPPKKVVP